MKQRGQYQKIAAVALGAFLAALLTLPLQAADPFTGSVSGWVKDERGIAQMGAAVAVLAADGRLIKRVFSDQDGQFSADGLFPGEYVIRVTLGRFLPVEKTRILVEAGAQAWLDISLRSLFATLQLSMPMTGQIRDMTDEWKWSLRSAHSMRPILRFQPREQQEERSRILRRVNGAFGETRAYAEVTSGAGMTPTAFANQSDLGTSFAVATSLFGDNGITVSGNVGYNTASQAPATAFRTSYQRDIGLGTPEISVTVRQLQTSGDSRAFLDPQLGSDAPTLETFTLGLGDRVQVSDKTTVEYGFLYESVRFIDRLDYVSPYGRIIQQLTPRRTVEVSYASGVPHPESAVQGGTEELRQEVSALGMFPRVALRDDRATVQRTEHVEIAYKERLGGGLLEAAVYQDDISDAAISALVPDSYQASGQVLPDLFSQASTLNGGRHEMRGYRVSYSRRLKDQLEAALGYGNTGVLAPGSQVLESVDLSDFRRNLSVDRAHLLTASVSAELKRSGTRAMTSYQWVSRDSVIAPDIYNDFSARSAPGLNILIRQPLPLSGPLPGSKFELTADIRNLLKAGYIPIEGADGQTIFVMPSVRSYRGSLSFIF
jgi:Carboxypeptidase regulatory-like domain